MDPIEQLHADASGVPGPGTEPGKTWLNSADVVNRIIRNFAAELLQSLGRPDFMDWLAFACSSMNSLFLGDGQSDVYSKGPWNRPDQLGEFVLKALQINGDTHTAVRDAFMVFANQMLSLVEEGEFNQTHQAEIDDFVRRLRDALLGITGLPTP